MKQLNNFERRVAELIEASIATKQSLLSSPDLVVTVATVSEILVNALNKETNFYCLATVGALLMHSI